MSKCIVENCESETRHISTKNEATLGVVSQTGKQKYAATRNYKCDNLHITHQDITFHRELLSKTPRIQLDVKKDKFYETAS